MEDIEEDEDSHEETNPILDDDLRTNHSNAAPFESLSELLSFLNSEDAAFVTTGFFPRIGTLLFL